MTDESSMEGSEWQNEGDDRSWDSEEDLVLSSQLCRVCAEASEDMIQCFGDRAKELQLVDKIHTHLPIMVTQDDLLPINVCTSCVSKLEICHELVINCLEADARLRTILGFDTMPTDMEQHGYTRPESPDSVDSSEKTEESQDDDADDDDDYYSVKADTKRIEKKEFEESEEKHQQDDKHNVEQKSGSKPEVKAGYQVILLKMKKSNSVSPDTQIQKAMKFLKTGGKTYKLLNTTSQKSLVVKKLQKDDDPDTGSQPKAPATQSQETEIHVKQEQTTKTEEKEAKGQTNEETGRRSADWDKIKYECIYCDENITGKKEFVLHQSSIHNNEVFGCEECVLVYELKEDFDEHVKSHQNEKENSITAEKSSSSTVSRDQPVDKGKRKDTSEFLTTSAKKAKFLENVNSNSERPVIIETENEGEKYWKCKVWQCKWCNHVATTKQGWKEHVCERLQDLQCSDQFDTEEELEGHQKTVHKEQCRKNQKIHQIKQIGEQRFQCAVCGKMYNSWVQLVQHSRVHLGQFKCPLCDRSFNLQSNLVSHIKRHKTERGFTCRICLETFSNRGELLSHRRNHSREELLGVKLPFSVKQEDVEDEETSAATSTSSLYKCPICYRTLPTQQRLENHVAMHTDNSFPCHICGKVLSKKNTLEYHLRTHTGEKPFTCSMCPATFQSRVGLIVHERIHTGEKPYQCDQCEMAFRCRATLNQHKVVHSDERPYRCMHCERGFRRRDTLDTHIRTHTDERPYACRICQRAFRQKGDCSKHEKTHDKHAKSVVLLTEGDSSAVYNCPLCGQMYELKEDLDHHFENEHTPEEKASSIVIINSENVITIPGIATVGEEIPNLVLHELH